MSAKKIIPKETLDKLIDAAFKAKENALCPYSNFRVGSAVLTKSGKIYSGCNVENACYGLSICAERVAICNAVTHGDKEILCVLTSTDIKDDFKWACGACTQFILEFGNEVQVYSVKPDRTVEMKMIRDLAPFSFSAQDLKKERI